jgi:hypothetical protein
MGAMSPRRRPAGQRITDRRLVPEAAELRLPDDALERLVVEHVAQVDERAGDRGDRDAAVDRAIGARQPAAVRLDARPPEVDRSRHARDPRVRRA